MAATSNLGFPARGAYILAGLGIALWGLYGADAAWARIFWLVLGSAVLLEGVIGYCVIVRMFVGDKSE